jgi:hypothetical protein
LTFFFKDVAMQTLELFRHIGDFVSLRIVVLNMMNGRVELVDESTLQTLDVA